MHANLLCSAAQTYLVGFARRMCRAACARADPSTSLLDWQTGEGTAKYWVTMLLIQSLRPGDTLFTVRVAYAPPAGVEKVCTEVGGWTSDGAASLSCDDPLATIATVEFADYGSPRGVCGSYQAR